MSIEIDVLNGDASWPRVEPLMNAVWPTDAVEKLSWGRVKWAHADLRVLIEAPEESPKPGLACHVGIYFRTATWNGRKVGLCDAGEEMTFHFGELIAHIAKTRNVRAGSIVGSGTVSNKGVEKNGKMDWPKGYSCIAEKRCIETILDGQPTTEFMKFGDTIRIEMKGRDGQSVFGAIEQEVVGAGAFNGVHKKEA